MRFVASLVLALLIGLMAPLSANATDAVRGGQIFTTNCAACHSGGGNIIKAERTLREADLKAHLPNYLGAHESAIVAQVTYGRNAMPAFVDVLSESEIADVAAYLEEQSSQGWS